MAKSGYYVIQTPVCDSNDQESNQYKIPPKVIDPKCCTEIYNIGKVFIPNTTRHKQRTAKSKQDVSLTNGTDGGSNQRIIDNNVFKISDCKCSIQCIGFSCFPVSQENFRATYKTHDELDESQMFMYFTRHDILEASSNSERVGNGNTEEGPSQVSPSTFGLRGLSLTSTTQIPSAAPISSLPSSSSHPTSIDSQQPSNVTSFPTTGSQDTNETLDDSLKDGQDDDDTNWWKFAVVLSSSLLGIVALCALCPICFRLSQRLVASFL